jgi:xanthine/uracil permease
VTGQDSARARTRLSRQRTGLGLLVLGLLLLRQGLTRDAVPEGAAGLVATACAVACLSPAVRWERPAGPLLLTGCVLLVCGLALTGVVVG